MERENHIPGKRNGPEFQVKINSLLFELLTIKMDVLRHNNNRMYTKQQLSLNI